MPEIIHVPSRAQIEKLQSEIINMPQLELPTEHYFSEVGMYCRKMVLPANTLIVGKTHKEAHFFICASGRMVVWTEDGMKTLNSGDVVCSQPGTKRAILTLTECIGMNIHKTDKTDLDEVEKELIEDDGLSLFDARNQLKVPAITVREVLICS